MLLCDPGRGCVDFADILGKVRELHFVVRALRKAVCGEDDDAAGDDVSTEEVNQVLDALGMVGGVYKGKDGRLVVGEEVRFLLEKLRGEAAGYSLRHKPINLGHQASPAQKELRVFCFLSLFTCWQSRAHFSHMILLCLCLRVSAHVFMHIHGVLVSNTEPMTK